MKHVPDSLYGMLPHLYVLGGMCVVLLVRHPLAEASGAVLVIAGLFVFNSRLKHRVKRQEMGAYGRCEMAHTCERRQKLHDRRGTADDRRAAAAERRTR